MRHPYLNSFIFNITANSLPFGTHRIRSIDIDQITVSIILHYKLDRKFHQLELQYEIILQLMIIIIKKVI
ncbi:unnamed protein product [Rotaria sordida]|uniref:Uncharacterized protein n=1 Tax=Rotaria sordida TaxID=392033 RepID=A0A814ABH4_9BILA|nr:unnamed protein product [Rotaria sordida]CAF0924964.1 unnamed protein product [Rotaria sordida]